MSFVASGSLAACSGGGLPRIESDSSNVSDSDGTSGDNTNTAGITLSATSPSTTTNDVTTEGESTSSGSTNATETGMPPGSSGSDGSTTGEPGSTSGSTSSGSGESSSSTTSTELFDTCFDVQMGVIPVDTAVSIPEIVVTGIAPSGNAFFAQHAEGGEYSGCYIYVNTVDISGLEIGDEVTVEGIVEEFSGLTEINASAGSVSETGSGVVVTPTVVALGAFDAPATAEPWEAVLVTIDEVAGVSVVSEPGAMEFVVQAGASTVVIDNYLFSIYANVASFPGFGVGASFSDVTGVVNYNASMFKVAPRAAGDFGDYAAP